MTEPDSHTDSEQSAEIEHFNYVQGDAEEEQAGSEGIDESSSPPNEASGSTTTSKIPTVNQEMQLETTEMLPNQAADLESGLSQIEAGENESTAPLEAPPPSNSAAEDRSGVSPNEADPAQPRKKRSDSLLRLRLAMRFIRKASSHAPTKNVVDTLPTANYASSFAPSSESQERNVTINVHPSQLPSQIHLDYRPSVASVHVMGRDSRNTLTGRRLSFDGGLAGISSLDVSTSSGTLSSTKGSNWAVAEQIEKNDTLSPSNAGPSPGRSRRSSLSVTPQAAGLSSGGRSRRSSISCGPPPPGLAHMAIVAPKLQTVQGSVMDADATGAALAAELSRADRVRLSIERTVAWDPVLLRRPLPLLSGDSEIPALQGSPEIPGTKEIIIAKGRPTVRDIEATRRSDIDTAESAIPVIQPNLEGPGEDGIPEMTIKNNLEPRTLIPVPVTKLRSVDVVPITLSEIDCAPSAAVDLLEQTPAERSSQGELADLNEENPAIGNNPGVKLSSQGGRRITILTKQGLKTLVLSRVPCDSSMDGFLSTKRTLVRHHSTSMAPALSTFSTGPLPFGPILPSLESRPLTSHLRNRNFIRTPPEPRSIAADACISTYSQPLPITREIIPPQKAPSRRQFLLDTLRAKQEARLQAAYLGHPGVSLRRFLLSRLGVDGHDGPDRLDLAQEPPFPAPPPPFAHPPIPPHRVGRRNPPAPPPDGSVLRTPATDETRLLLGGRVQSLAPTFSLSRPSGEYYEHLGLINWRDSGKAANSPIRMGLERVHGEAGREGGKEGTASGGGKRGPQVPKAFLMRMKKYEKERPRERHVLVNFENGRRALLMLDVVTSKS